VTRVKFQNFTQADKILVCSRDKILIFAWQISWTRVRILFALNFACANQTSWNFKILLAFLKFEIS